LRMGTIHQFLYRTGVVWKTAIASALSWEAARLAGSDHPYLAPLSAILCLQATLDKSIRFGVQRILGTIAGVLVTACLAPYIGMNAWSLGLTLSVTAAAMYGARLNKAAIDQVALSILLVLYFQNLSPSYGLDRIRDTLIGCAVAIVIHMFAYPPNFTKKAIREWYAYTDHLADLFSRSCHWLKQDGSAPAGDALQDDARKLYDELDRTIDQFGQAATSLHFHPFTRSSRTVLQQFQAQMVHLKQGYDHLTGMLRTLAEWSRSGEMNASDREAWAPRLSVAADLIRDWKSKMQLVEQGKGEYFIPTVDASGLAAAAPIDPASSRSPAVYRYAYALHNDLLQLSDDFA